MNNMTVFFKTHQAYFIPLLLYFGLGISLLLWIEKGDLVRFFSGTRSDFWNYFFIVGTRLGEEYIYVLAFFGLLLKKYRYAFCVPLAGILTAIFSFSIKAWFAHLRPKLWFEQLGETLTFVPEIYVNVGPTSFPSGHTFSAFTVFGFLALVSEKWWLKTLFVFTAMITAVSRVYLVQHFLEDIVFGAFLGTLVALGVFLLQERWSGSTDKWWNKGLSFG